MTAAPEWRGLVVAQSLTEGCLPVAFCGRIVGRQEHSISGAPVTILEVTVAAGDIDRAVDQLTDQLRSPGWYAHLVNGDDMIVVLPGEHVRVSRGDRTALARAQAAGARHGVPTSQLRFDELFDSDHPADSKPGKPGKPRKPARKAPPELERTWVMHPGATLREWRLEHGLSVTQAAFECACLRPDAYERLEAGSEPLTELVAARLEHGTSIPARLWLGLEREYRDGLATGKTWLP